MFKKKNKLTPTEQMFKLIDEYEHRQNEKICNTIIDTILNKRIQSVYGGKQSEDKIGEYKVDVKSNIRHTKSTEKFSRIIINIHKVVRDDKDYYYHNVPTKRTKIVTLEVTGYSENQVQIYNAGDISYETLADKSKGEGIHTVFAYIEKVLSEMPKEIKLLLLKNNDDLITYIYTLIGNQF